ncbi:SMP-30/gluconolactonase/LRE family protein [Rubripirellula amarantea]|nr:SMP-30/gluconolactonase/LRE family protein [Rubripirellula amarantea]
MNRLNRLKPVLCGLFLLAVSNVALAQATAAKVTADGATLKKVASGLMFTEGPAADDQGNVYFTDQPNDQILFYDFAADKVQTWLQPCGRSNGLYFGSQPRARLIACADEKNELWSIDLDTKEHEVLAKGFEGRDMSGPNDCWVDRDGSIYFTDPLYQRPYWTKKFPDNHPRSVFRVTSDGNVTRVASDLTQPNGIIGDAERRQLYVADIDAKTVYRYSIAEDGSLNDKKVFCKMGSDGLTIDEQRNVYLTNNEGVTVFNSEGEKVQTIAVPEGWTANVTFAGPQKKHLFITASKSAYVIEMNVAGL